MLKQVHCRRKVLELYLQIIKVNIVMIIDSEKTVISVIVLSPFTSSQDKPPILPNSSKMFL